MTKEEYLNNPCAASSLPFWKTEQVIIPENVCIIRDDEFDISSCPGRDVPYFKLMNSLENTPSLVLDEAYILTDARVDELKVHIAECYREEGIAANDLETYLTHDVFDEDLWVAVRDKETGRIVASGIAEIDTRIGEGVLEWIQVSADCRRKGLGRFVVSELLRRLSSKASFVTVSGQLNSTHQPMKLYLTCGFTNPVIWHVVTR